MADNNFDEILEKIASNPGIIEKISHISENVTNNNAQESLAKIMEAISPVVAPKENDKSGEKSDTPPVKSNDTPFSLPIAKLGEKIAKNSKLLIALKPYLSAERCEIIDTVIKIAQVGDLMKLVK